MSRKALTLAHGDGIFPVVLGDDDAVGIVDNSAADSVGKGGLTDFLMPSANVELGTEDGGSLFITGLSNLKQVPGLRILERIQQSFQPESAPQRIRSRWKAW